MLRTFFLLAQPPLLARRGDGPPTSSMRTQLALIFVVLLAGAVTFSAHHGTSSYDMSTEISLTGTVKEWTYGNPHTWLRLTVTSPPNPAEEWSIESAPPNYLTAQGWSPSTLKANERLTVLISPLKGEPKHGILLEVKRNNGETLVVRPRGSFGRPRGSTRRQALGLALSFE